MVLGNKISRFMVLELCYLIPGIPRLTPAVSNGNAGCDCNNRGSASDNIQENGAPEGIRTPDPQ
jgi:hypothetical protein